LHCDPFKDSAYAAIFLDGDLAIFLEIAQLAILHILAILFGDFAYIGDCFGDCFKDFAYVAILLEFSHMPRSLWKFLINLLNMSHTFLGLI